MAARAPRRPAALREERQLDRIAASQSRTESGRQTRQSILAAATALFAAKGFSGANVNEIVAAAGTTKPMIYYHFGSKEGLFAAVLEEVYAGMRAAEGALRLDDLPPAEAMRRLVETTFDYHAAHPDWVRLISVANIHDAEQVRRSPTIAARNAGVVEIMRGLLARGEAAGAFRRGVDPLHLHMLIASMSFYRVSNRHTWKVIFQRDLFSAAEAAQQREMLVQAVLRSLAPGGM
jgi:AcrR family transcriptional regulator